MKRLILVVVGSILSFSTSAQLSEGDIMFVGYNADGSDGFSAVAMNNIPANTTIYFSDNEWNGLPLGSGGAFNNLSEGEMTWNTGASIILAGVVVNFRAIKSASSANYGATIGTISGVISLNAANEVLYAYSGNNDATPTIFLSAISNSTFNNTNGTLINTGLTNGVNAIAVSGNEDVMVYSGATICTPNITNCTLGIANPTNWSTEDGGGNQSQNAVYPDFPDDVPLVFVTTGILPVTIASFTVSPYENNKAKVEWVTATEINNDNFTIERSIDASEWEIMATIDGAGNSMHALNYETIDANPYFGTSYYRLKQTDFNGDFDYFPIVSFKLEAKIDIILYPNPVTYNLSISGSNIQNAEILLFDNLSRNITMTDIQRDTDKVNFDVSFMPPGIYMLKVVNGGQLIIKKFKKE